MGIPGLFKYIRNKYRNDRRLLEKPQDVDYLHIDGNGLIHPACADVKSKTKINTPIDILEQNMINKVIENIEEVITKINPNILTYLAIDGVAPAAKMVHQRNRRFKGYQDSLEISQLKKKYNIPEEIYWSNACITPGTIFMEKLNCALEDWASKSKNAIIYSSYLVPGEGEHKILRYIKDNKGSHCIYGLDADLIFLSMASEVPNIHLARDMETESDTIYVNIDIMKELILKTIGGTSEDILCDFIFICFLLGNDFLPHFIAIDTFRGGIDILIEAYQKIILSSNTTLLDKHKKIIYSSFIEFIKYLSSIEDDLIKKSLTYRSLNSRPQNTTPFEIKLYERENMMFSVPDPIKYGVGSFSDYRDRHYAHYYKKDISQELSFEFLKMIEWNIQYYFEGPKSWLTFYKYHTAPFLNDLIIHISEYISEPLASSDPVSPFLQLLIVLPKQLSYLLPKVFKHIMNDPNSPIAYLYPTYYIQDFIHINKHWLAKSILPIMNIESIKTEYLKYVHKLTKDEIKRNTNIFLDQYYI
jgi:5'-3' exoribonuclease 2